ncbi:hypothetical protein AK812_SmicGene48710, partial [Symbiodinium microadriaticum]
RQVADVHPLRAWLWRWRLGRQDQGRRCAHLQHGETWM